MDSLHKTVYCLNLDTDQAVKMSGITELTTALSFFVGREFCLFREPLVEYLDYRIFLEIGFDEVLRRAAIRDVPEIRLILF